MSNIGNIIRQRLLNCENNLVLASRQCLIMKNNEVILAVTVLHTGD